MRRAPSTPEEIAARRKALLDSVGPAQVREMQRRRERDKNPAKYEDAHVDLERALNLEARGVDFSAPSGRLKYAQRADVWHRLQKRDAITSAQLAAVRRLERDMALRHGVRIDDPGERVVVDQSTDYQGSSQRQIDAGERVDEVLRMIGPPACRVLQDILERPIMTGLDVDWREAIARITGETRQEAQTALLRFAAQAVADVYDALDRARLRR